MENIKLLADRVLIKTNEKTKSGFILTGDSSQDEIQEGVVEAVGPGKHNDAGFIATDVKVGDRVLFQYAKKIELDGESYLMTKEEDILLIMNK